MNDTDQKKSAIVVMHHMPSHQALMRSNRWLLRCVLFLMAVIFVGGFFLLPDDGEHMLKQQAVYVEKTHPRLLAEMDALKGQMVGLVSGSIESKLRSLEASIQAGSLNGSLGTIEDIKNDLKILQGYNSNQPAPSVVQPDNGQLIQEMSHLKRLIYFILASCGLMLAAVAGVWIRHQRLPYKETIVRFLKGL